jgi:hypothetical protein
MIEITSCENGYVVVIDDRRFVAFTLMDAARLTGETAPIPGRICYAPGKSREDVWSACRMWEEGLRISAIKELRDVYNVQFGLQEIKELFEAFQCTEREVE